MTNFAQTFAFIRKELAGFIGDAVRPSQPPPSAPDEAGLIARASAGAAVRQFLESEQIQEFMARSEAQLTNALIALPLDDDKGRRNLAVAIQTQRQWLRFLTETARDGRSAEAELKRLAGGAKAYF